MRKGDLINKFFSTVGKTKDQLLKVDDKLPLGVKQGWLYVYLSKKWSECYCILRSDSIFYYTTKQLRDLENQVDSPGMIPLNISSSVLQTEEADGIEKEFGFKVEDKDLKFLLSAKNSEDRELWVNAVRSVVVLHTPRARASSAIVTSADEETWLTDNIRDITELINTIMKRIVKDKSWCTDKVYDQLANAGNILLQILNCNKILSINPNNVAVRSKIIGFLRELYSILGGNSPLASTIHMSKAIPDHMALDNLLKNSIAKLDKLSKSVDSPGKDKFINNTSSNGGSSISTQSNTESNLYNTKMKENYYNQFGKSESSNKIASPRPDRTATTSNTTNNTTTTTTFNSNSTQNGTNNSTKSKESEETKTYQEEIFEAAKTIVLSTKRMIAARKYSVKHSEQDVSTEAAKDIVGATKIILTITNKFAKETGYEKPQAVAHEINESVVDLISKMKEIMSATESAATTRENVRDIVRQKLPDLMRKVVQETQNAHEIYLAEKQLLSSVETIQKAASELSKVLESKIESQIVKKIELSATAIASTLAKLPQHLKIRSKSALFESIKILGSQATEFLKTSEEVIGALEEKSISSTLSPNSNTSTLRNVSKTLKTFNSSSNLLSDLKKSTSTTTTTTSISSNNSGSEDTKTKTTSAENDDTNNFLDIVETIRSTSLQLLYLGKNAIEAELDKVAVLEFAGSSSLVASGISQLLATIQSFVLEPPSSGNVRAVGRNRKFDDEIDVEKQLDEEVTPLEDEKDDPSNIIVEMDENGQEQVRCGTLNKLVRRLTLKSTDLKYQKTFLTTYRSFTTPHELFTKLIQLYNARIPKLPRGVSFEEYKQTTIKPVQLRIINILKSWIDSSFFDFDNKLLYRIGFFIDNTITDDGYSELAKQLRNAINKRASRSVRASRIVRTDTIMFNNMANKVISPTQILANFDEAEIARQLTIIDGNSYSLIKPAELLNQAWNKPELKHRAGNVLYMIERFNQLSSWTAQNVLMPDKLTERVKVYQKMINIAEQCRQLNNYNSMLAIISGLNNSAVYRLQFTRAELPEKITRNATELNSLMSSENAYKLYREALHSANPQIAPVVPYLGVYLTDLTFIDVGNKDIVNNLINFRKRELVADIIMEVQLYQQGHGTSGGIKANPQLVALLNQLTYIDDEKLYQLSLLREPRSAERTDLS